MKNKTIYHDQLGQFQISIISDGGFPVTRNFFIKNAPEKVIDMYSDSFLAPLNFVLIQNENKKILIDAGFGKEIGAVAGNLVNGLNTINILPEQIDLIIITHVHLDHIGGLLEQTHQIYPNATYIMSKREYDFIMEETSSREYQIISCLKDRISLIEEDVEVKNGIKVIHYPGHTPGHLVVEIESEDQILIVTNDLFNIPLSITYPDMCIEKENSQKLGKISRELFIKNAFKKDALIHACHFPFPGLGKIKKTLDTYSWETKELT
ncbi:metallo-beta-lactamase superfamily protein [Bacillus sp. BK006]|nr:metallo-beta-lactamase superfamily protein [Bacillus sp. BK006]